MKMTLLNGLLITALVSVSGCVSQTTRDVQAGPKFTEAQKDAMSEDAKLTIYNAQVREKDQLVCKRVQRVGSRIKDRVCRTHAEIELERAAAREALRSTRGDNARVGGAGQSVTGGGGGG